MFVKICVYNQSITTVNFAIAYIIFIRILVFFVWCTGSRRWLRNATKIMGESNSLLCIQYTYILDVSSILWIYLNRIRIFFSSAEHIQCVDEIHVCKKSMDLDVEVKRLTEKFNRFRALCNDKSRQMKKLSRLDGHYQRVSLAETS